MGATVIPSPLQIRGDGAGALPGGAGSANIVPVDGDPSGVVSAPRGSVVLDTTNGVLYVNTSAGATGTTWTSYAPSNVSNPTELPAQEIDLSANANFTDTITADTTYTFANLAVGAVVVLRQTISGGAVTAVNLPASAKIVGGGAASVTDGDVNVITFSVFDDSTPIVHVSIGQES